MKLSILHPSRSRPARSEKTLTKWLDDSGLNDIEVIVSLDIDDPYLSDYTFTSSINSDVGYSKVKIASRNRSAVDAINNAAKSATGDIFIVVSDDTDCPLNWGQTLLKHLEGKTDFIVKTQDGIQDWIITNPIMDRAYYNRFGYVYYPEYSHMFCDTELSCVADLTMRRIDVPMTFEHLHYSTGKSIKDSVNEKADSTWNQGETLFIKRALNNFDLVNPPGKIMSLQYLNWLKMKGIRL